MKITIQTRDASDEDCKRDDYYTVVDGREILLASCALPSTYTERDVEAKVRQLFGLDAAIIWK